MLKAERQRYIMEQLQQFGKIRVSDLSTMMQVDPVTIRRDLNELERDKRLMRVHGGAITNESTYGIPPEGTSVQRIAQKAGRLIEHQSVVFIGPGTLTASVIPYLGDKQNLIIMTNSLQAAWAAAQQGKHTLHLIGGQVEPDLGVYGDPGALDHIRADWVLLEAEGLDAVRGLTHSHQGFATMAKQLINLSSQVMVLLPPQRVGGTGALHIAAADAVDVVITEREASNSPLWDLSELGIRVILA